MNKHYFWKVSLFCGLMVGFAVLPGCSSQPTLGERMMDQSAGTSELGEQWSKGNENLQKGEKLIKQGNKMVEDARSNMREGEDKIIAGKKLVNEGTRQMEDSEQVYKNRFPRAYERIHQNP